MFVGVKEVNCIDGVCVEYEDGFGLVCLFNIMLVVVMCFEVDNDVVMVCIQSEFCCVILVEKLDV